MSAPTNILIDAPAWIGDMVMAQTLFNVLKKQYPNATITVLAPHWTAPLLRRMAEVDHSLELPFKHGEWQLRKRYQFAKTLRDQHYDHVILLRNSFKSALIPFWARIPHRTGWLGEHRYGLLNDWRKLDKQRYPLMIERFMALAYAANTRLAKPYPTPQLIINLKERQQTCQQLQINDTGQPTLILCAGAEYGSAKRWPAEHFAAVAQQKLQQGWRVWLLGCDKDQAITQQINQHCEQRCLDLAGKTDLNQAIDLLSLADSVVANDSGLMHVAAALKRPLVVLYGSSSAQFTPPLTDTVRMLSLNLNCSPCFKRTCPLGHTNCLQQLSPALVLTAIQELTT